MPSFTALFLVCVIGSDACIGGAKAVPDCGAFYREALDAAAERGLEVRRFICRRNATFAL